jgi:hypothetical protein
MIKICNPDSDWKDIVYFYSKSTFIIHDLQTRNETVFHFNEDLKVFTRKDTSLISVVTRNRIKCSLFVKEAFSSFKEGHKTLSVFTKPYDNSYTRTDRLTCLFCIILMTLLVDIVYYDSDNSTIQNDLIQIGSFKITAEQVSPSFIFNYDA